MRIRIETMTDEHECEDCGTSYAEGGRVYIDDELVLERIPSAYCYDAPSFSETDLLLMALKSAGHEVTVDDTLPFVSSHDDEYHGEDE